MSLPTPDIPRDTDYAKVYEPAEDSFLFLDALESEASFLLDLCPAVALEIGPGTGIVSVFLSRILKKGCCTCLCNPVCVTSDINAYAASVVQKTAALNGATIESINASFSPLIPGKVDVLLFNPPYVVSAPEEVGSHGIEAAWAGGIDGRQVIDQLLPLVPVLSC